MDLSRAEAEELVKQVTSPEHTAIADREHQRQQEQLAELREQGLLALPNHRTQKRSS